MWYCLSLAFCFFWEKEQHYVNCENSLWSSAFIWTIHTVRSLTPPALNVNLMKWSFEKRKNPVSFGNMGFLEGHCFIMGICSYKAKLITWIFIWQMWAPSGLLSLEEESTVPRQTDFLSSWLPWLLFYSDDSFLITEKHLLFAKKKGCFHLTFI